VNRTFAIAALSVIAGSAVALLLLTYGLLALVALLIAMRGAEATFLISVALAAAGAFLTARQASAP
jgi:hypothetical protein